MTDDEKNDILARHHMAVVSLLKFFAYDHLPSALQKTSKTVHDLAWAMAANGDLRGPELTAGLRKLLEAKDCFERSGLRI